MSEWMEVLNFLCKWAMIICGCMVLVVVVILVAVLLYLVCVMVKEGIERFIKGGKND